MGFIARRFTKYLLQHGQLAKQCRIYYEDQRLLELQSSTAQSDGVLSLILSLQESAYHVHNLQLDTNHVAMLFIAVLVITSYKKKDREQKRKHRVYNSTQQKKSSSKDMDTITLVLANISLYLMAILCISSIVGDSLVELKQLVSEDIWIRTISRQLLENYLFIISLCSILMSILLTVIGYVWSFLDPRNTTTTYTETKQKKTWQRLASTMVRNLAISISVEVVLAVAYIYLPFIGKIVHEELDFGLPKDWFSFLTVLYHPLLGIVSSPSCSQDLRQPCK